MNQFLITSLIQSIINKNTYYALVLIIFLIVLTSIVTGVRWLIAKHRTKKSVSGKIDLPDWLFKKFNAESLWKDVEAEYKQIAGYDESERSYEQFIEENTDKIFVYCCSYISYLAAWLIRHDAIKWDVIDVKSSVIENIKNENDDAAEFIFSYFDGKLCREYISENMIGFLDSYYESLPHRKECYETDYNNIVKSKSDKRFCIDFSWDIYRDFEMVLNKRYDYYQRSRCLEDYDYETWLIGTRYSESLKQSFEIRVQPVDESEKAMFDKYVLRCTEEINHFSMQMIKQICTELNEWMYETTYGSFIENIGAIEIIIFKPYGNETAYVLGFEADFEPEHGISVTVRDNKVIDIGYRSDWDTPWSKENEEKYMQMI